MLITISGQVAYDYYDRFNNVDELGEIDIVKRTKTLWTLRLTPEQLQNFFDDCDYYAEYVDAESVGRAFLGAMARARSTAWKQVRKQIWEAL